MSNHTTGLGQIKRRDAGPLETVRIGIVGAGFMARTHSLAYRSAELLYGHEMPRIEQVRLADVRADTAQTAADAFGWREATGDWREITRADDIDLVDIVTPNNTHAEIAIDAANYGKHILCEKPLAHTLEDAERMYEAAEAAGVLTQVGFVFRTWPAAALAKQLIEGGRVGKIRHLRAWYFHDYALDPDHAMGWRTQRAVAGAGAIGDLGSHVIDLARYLAGEITEVYARTRTLIANRPTGDGSAPVDVDDMADVMVEFSSGATGVIHTNWMAAGHKTDIGFELIGERGALSFTWERCNELRYYSHDETPGERGYRTIHIGPHHPGAEHFWPVAGQGLGYGDAFTILIGRLITGGIVKGEAKSPNFLDGLRAATVLDAIGRSSTAQRRVAVPPAQD